jgi:hypothetical protein
MTVDFTAEEHGALLRAARGRLDSLMEEISRLHDLNGADDGYNRALADIQSVEYKHLQDAVRKLWTGK